MVARGGRLSFSAGRSWRVAEGVGRCRGWSGGRGGGGRLRVGVPAGAGVPAVRGLKCFQCCYSVSLVFALRIVIILD